MRHLAEQDPLSALPEETLVVGDPVVIKQVEKVGAARRPYDHKDDQPSELAAVICAGNRILDRTAASPDRYSSNHGNR
jgi:hypothetical protein